MKNKFFIYEVLPFSAKRKAEMLAKAKLGIWLAKPVKTSELARKEGLKDE